MNNNLFSKEFTRNAASMVIWTLVITILISVTMAIYPVFLENQSKITALFSILPKGALQFKGISNVNDLLSVLGFYAVNNIIYMMVLGSIYSIVLFSGILLKEEYNKTAEYLLTRPITRSEIFTSKLAVAFLNIILLNCITSLAGFLFMHIVKTDTFSVRAFLILSVYTLLLNILFGAIGLFVSTLIKRARPITTFSIGLVLIMYFIYTLSKITPGASKIGYLSPFRFADVDALNPEYSLHFWNFMYFAGISAVLMVLAYRNYRKKDIYI